MGTKEIRLKNPGFCRETRPREPFILWQKPQRDSFLLIGHKIPGFFAERSEPFHRIFPVRCPATPGDPAPLPRPRSPSGPSPPLTAVAADHPKPRTRPNRGKPGAFLDTAQKESNPLHRPIGSATDRDSCVLGDPRAPPGMVRLEPVPVRGMSPVGRRQRGLGFPSSAAPNRSRALRTRLSGVGCDH